MPAVGALNHITLSVADLERSFGFYTQVLGFRPLARWKQGAYLLAGESTWVCLTSDDRRSAVPAEYSHLAFSATAESFPQLTARIVASGARAWQANTSEGESHYFLDPDGHKLEIHVGDFRSRLAACKQQPYEGMEFF